MTTASSPGEVAARLVVEFCLPMIQGKRDSRAPVLGRQLSASERADLGATGEGMMMVFEAKPAQIYMDLAGSQALVWFNGADCESAAGVFDAVLRAAFPQTQQLEEVAHPSGRAMRVRAYETDLGGGKLSRIEAGFPNAGAPDPDRAFVVRVNALERSAAAPAPGAAARAAAPPPPPPEAPTPPEPKKKKGWF